MTIDTLSSTHCNTVIIVDILCQWDRNYSLFCIAILLVIINTIFIVIINTISIVIITVIIITIFTNIIFGSESCDPAYSSSTRSNGRGYPLCRGWRVPSATDEGIGCVLWIIWGVSFHPVVGVICVIEEAIRTVVR